MARKHNPLVFLDISIDGDRPARITLELFSNVVPKTAENFRALCTGERGIGLSTQKPLHFKGSRIHRIVSGFMAQGGDFSKGDGSGGESIYGGKFPDENFKLKHDGPGILSMANSGLNTNGSQFFITFKATPHLDGKHVVFGKVIRGMALLKKMEEAGSRNGEPICPVKIVDCGETSDGKIEIALGTEKEKKLGRSKGMSESEGRVREKQLITGSKRIKKRRYSSSETDISESTDSQSSLSDSVSGSDHDSYSSVSSSSESSSSSDHRHKRRKKISKDNYKPGKNKRNHHGSRRQSKHGRRIKRKSKWSSESSSPLESASTSSGSSDIGKEDRRTDPCKAKPSSQSAVQEKPTSPILEEDKTRGDSKKNEVKAAESDAFHKNGKIFPKNAHLPDNDDALKDRFAKTAKQHPNSEEKLSGFRELPGPGLRSSPRRPQTNANKIQRLDSASGGGDFVTETGRSRQTGHSKTLAEMPSNKGHEPALDSGKGLTRSPSPGGLPKRTRKGRGFTQQYAFVRKYRTPSPEHSPVRSRYYAGRQERGSYWNRSERNRTYNEVSAGRRYHGSPRRSSPLRYRRREQSRSISRSPTRHRDSGRFHGQSHRRSHSPVERRSLAENERLEPNRHGKCESSPLAQEGRLRARSKGRGSLASQSPETGPLRQGNMGIKSPNRF